MDEFLTEKEQIEAARKWWDENGRFVITGLVLGIAVLVGWNYWKSYKLNYSQSASALHDQLMVAVQNNDSAGAMALADQIATDYGSSSYADQAPFAVARIHVEAGDLDAAANTLEPVATSSGDLGHVARLRLARIRLGQERASDALAVLSVASVPENFAPLYDELRGDAHAALGDTDAAREAYQRVLDNEDAVVDRAYVTVKLDSLGAAADTD